MAGFLKKSWVWILSGLAILLGGCRLVSKEISCVYGPPKVYGPPPPRVKNHTSNNHSIPEIVEPENDPEQETENEPGKDEEPL